MPNAAESRHALLNRRVRALRGRLAKFRADAMLITNPRDIRYLTGFVGDDSWALVRKNASGIHVFSDFRFQEQIQCEAPQVRAVMRKKSLTEELARAAGRLRLRRIALQGDHVTLAQRKTLVKHLGASRLTVVDDQLLQQRAVKDDSEIHSIRRALGIQQEAYRRTLRFLKPGVTESQVAGYLEYQMRQLGAGGPGFPTIVAFDANASLPHAVPGARKLRKGSLVLIDWGARWNGYRSDLTRVVAVGKMAPRMRDVYKLVLEAQRAALDAVAPGKRLADIDAVARKIIDKAGYAKNFGHSLGHGIGLDIHEQPVLSQRAKGVLEPGHIVTVEPGVYLPGVGGVRIEDDVLVTVRGREILSSLPTDLESAMI